MAEEDEVQDDVIEAPEDAGDEGSVEGADELDALEDAVAGGDDDADLDPAAEEMLEMMEDEAGEGAGPSSQENLEQMMESEMRGGTGAVDAGGAAVSPNVARLMDVNLMVSIELGRTRKTLEDVTDMGEQSLVELDKEVGELVDILVNGRLFARGEVVTVSEKFGVRIVELVTPANQL